MLNMKAIQGITLVILFSLALAGCGGAAVDSYKQVDTPAETPTLGPITFPIVAGKIVTDISTVTAGYAATAELVGGAKYYYCDCGTDSETDCVPGNDTNPGTDKQLPRRTIANAAARFGSTVTNMTVALCKGGAFNVLANTVLNIGNGSCGSSTCNDLREYTPTTFTGTAKPIINKATGVDTLFRFSGSGGVRILNLTLSGKYGISSGYKNEGFFFYNGAHDVTMGNLDMDGFSFAIDDESSGPAINNRIKLSGSKITNSHAMGYYGSSTDSEISYNLWDGNGSSNDRDHTIYLSAHKPVTGMKVIGNYIHGQYGPACNGAPVVGHGGFTNLVMKDNVIDVDAAATRAACFGIAFGHGGYAEANFLINSSFSGNILVNTGNTALVVSGCPDCIIENNLIMQDWSYSGGAIVGIAVAQDAARTTPADELNTRNLIRNNTVWYGPHTTGGAVGIRVRTEGTGHKISNNTVVYNSTTATGGVSCFDYPLALVSYAFINNNHCYSNTTTYSWVAGKGDLAAWKASPGASAFDTLSQANVDPKFTAVGTVITSDFTLLSTSPLLGQGDNTEKAILDIKGSTRPSPPAIGAYQL